METGLEVRREARHRNVHPETEVEPGMVSLTAHVIETHTADEVRADRVTGHEVHRVERERNGVLGPGVRRRVLVPKLFPESFGAHADRFLRRTKLHEARQIEAGRIHLAKMAGRNADAGRAADLCARDDLLRARGNGGARYETGENE